MGRVLTILLLVACTSAHAETAPSASDIAGCDGLHRAAHESDVSTMRQLVAEKADLNARDRSGRTPAHVAAFASNDATLRILAEAGADMNALENRVYDVLTIATVSTQIQAGADITTPARDGVTPLQHAEARAIDQIADMIREAQPTR